LGNIKQQVQMYPDFCFEAVSILKLIVKSKYLKSQNFTHFLSALLLQEKQKHLSKSVGKPKVRGH
jgi:hypothetical protein